MCTIAAPLLLLLFAAADEKPAPKLPLGKETTIVSGPLDKDGYIDYETALNERLGKGITPDRNANVLLWKAFGPRPEGGKGMPAEFFKQMGIEQPAEEGEYFVGISEYMKARPKLDGADWDTINEQQDRATQRPWAAKDYPHIAGWLKANDKPLALVVEAVQRPAYFNPLTSGKTEKGPGALMEATLPAVQKCRALCCALTARAMLRVNEGKFDAAWQDLIACHRLARLVGSGGTIIEGLVGISIEAVVSRAELVYLERAGLTVAQVRDRLTDLRKLPPLVRMADKIDLTERFMYLDSVQLIRRRGPGGGKPNPQAEQALALIDWEPALRGGNGWYDRMAAALRAPDRAEREKQLGKIEEDLKAVKKDAAALENLGRLIKAGGTPDKEVGKAIGDVLISLLMPAACKVQSAADRAEQIQRNLHVAFALAAYRADRGRYPAKLADLAPKYLGAVPGDLFSGKALIYRLEEKGYLLYSVGANGLDEGGRWYGDNPPGDDPNVRMPLPELKRQK